MRLMVMRLEGLVGISGYQHRGMQWRVKEAIGRRGSGYKL